MDQREAERRENWSANRLERIRKTRDLTRYGPEIEAERQENWPVNGPEISRNTGEFRCKRTREVC